MQELATISRTNRLCLYRRAGKMISQYVFKTFQEVQRLSAQPFGVTMLKLSLLFSFFLFFSISLPSLQLLKVFLSAGKRQTFVPDMRPGHNNTHGIFNIAGNT